MSYSKLFIYPQIPVRGKGCHRGGYVGLKVHERHEELCIGEKDMEKAGG